MNKLLNKIGGKFSEYERFNAINGKLITEDDKNSLLSLKSKRLYNYS